MTTARAYAKINLSLNVIGKYGDYHELDTVVISVDLFDKIRVKRRKDDIITLKVVGENVEFPENDNAYKAAVLFRNTYKTNGVDITVYKGIPKCGGVGGSSALSAATLNAMAKEFKIADDLSAIANGTGSDTAFQLKGGFARLRGRGEKIQFFTEIPQMHFVVAIPEGGVNTKECFDKFDRVGGDCFSDNDRLIKSLLNGETPFEGDIKNALYRAASQLNGDIEKVKKACDELSPLFSGMSGSGSAVFAVFETRELCLWAEEKLKKRGIDAVAVDSVSRTLLNK